MISRAGKQNMVASELSRTREKLSAIVSGIQYKAKCLHLCGKQTEITGATMRSICIHCTQTISIEYKSDKRYAQTLYRSSIACAFSIMYTFEDFTISICLLPAILLRQDKIMTYLGFSKFIVTYVCHLYATRMCGCLYQVAPASPPTHHRNKCLCMQQMYLIYIQLK